jgi:predicted PurR-regulated permease PerM
VVELLSNKHWTLSKAVPEASAMSILVGIAVVAALYFGREVLVPLALAVLLSFVLSPLVRLLQGCYFPRSLAVIAVALVAFAAIFGLGALMVSQINELAKDLPHYQTTLAKKIESLRSAAAGSSTMERASEALHDLSTEIDKPKGNPSPSMWNGMEPNNKWRVHRISSAPRPQLTMPASGSADCF